jgi:serine/threonine-protein kinase RsbW
VANAQMKEWILPATMENAKAVCAEISAWLDAANLPDQQFALQLLALEALSNAIIHGSKKSPEKKIYCEMQISSTENGSKGKICLKVTDEGPGFDWKSAMSIDNVPLMNEHGRGVQIYRLYADQVEFNQKGNSVKLSRNLASR